MHEAAAHVVIKGRVQGVGYRFFALDAANIHRLKGWVRNVPDGDVECVVEGPRPSIDDFLEALRKGPSMARVDAVHISWKHPTFHFSEFSIR